MRPEIVRSRRARGPARSLGDSSLKWVVKRGSCSGTRAQQARTGLLEATFEGWCCGRRSAGLDGWCWAVPGTGAHVDEPYSNRCFCGRGFDFLPPGRARLVEATKSRRKKNSRVA